MNEDFDDFFYNNECIRSGICDGYYDLYSNYEEEWFKNYQLLKLLIEFKNFFEINKIDYKIDTVYMYKKFIEKEVIEEYERITFADFCLNYIINDLCLCIKLCIDSVDELKEMYDEYDVYLNTYALGVDFFSDIYALTYAPGGCSWDLLEGLQDDLIERYNECLGIECSHDDAFEHLGELVEYMDQEIVDSLSVKEDIDISCFICFEPYKVLRLIKEMGVCTYETATVR